MGNKDILGRLIIGAMINFVVLYILEQVDNRLAILYLFIVFLIILLTYGNQIFPNVNLLLGTIRGRLS